MVRFNNLLIPALSIASRGEEPPYTDLIILINPSYVVRVGAPVIRRNLAVATQGLPHMTACKA